MRTLVRLSLLCVLLLTTTAPALAKPPKPPPPPPVTYPECGYPRTDLRYTGTLPSGAAYLICIPNSWITPFLGWNGDLVVYAHGYAPRFTTPSAPEFKDLTLGGAYVPNAVEQMRYAFATTTYRDTGLVVTAAQEDLVQLVQQFISIRGSRPPHIILTGASEGGLIATLLAENPDRTGKGRKVTRYFDGVLAACGPIGDFQWQTNYLGDFRVLWDALYTTGTTPTPPYIPNDPISIDPTLVVPESGTVTAPTDPWRLTYQPYILNAVNNGDPDTAAMLLGAAGAAWDPQVPDSRGDTAQQILWYNIYATNDAMAKLGGNPYENLNTVYQYNSVPIAISERYTEDAAAAEAIAALQTTGGTKIPLVTLHTTGDPVVPYHHEELYAAKLAANAQAQHSQRSAARYGHCNFTTDEVVSAFTALTGMLP